MRTGGMLLAVAFSAASARGAAVEPPAPMEYPHAGIAVTLPERLIPLAPRDPFEVVRAARVRGGRTVLAMSLSAFPVAAKVQARAFAEAMLAELKRRGGVQNVKVRGKGSVRIAGVDAEARRISYYLDDREKIAAVRAAFIRRVDRPAVRICYFLSLRAPAEQEAEIPPVLDAVARGIELMDLVRPSAETMGQAGQTLKFPEHGFEIRLPRAWYVAPAGGRHRAITAWRGKVLAMEMPLQMGQTDYIARERTGPRASVVVADTPGQMPSEALARRACGAGGESRAARRGVWEAAAPMAGLPGHQRVLKLAPRRGAGLKEPLTRFIVARAVCLPAGRRQAQARRPEVPTAPAEGRRGRGYALVLRCRATSREAATAMMDKLAAGFSLPGAATRPASQPAGGPATEPASAPTGPAASAGPEKTPLRPGAK